MYAGKWLAGALPVSVLTTPVYVVKLVFRHNRAAAAIARVDAIRSGSRRGLVYTS